MSRVPYLEKRSGEGAAVSAGRRARRYVERAAGGWVSEEGEEKGEEMR